MFGENWPWLAENWPLVVVLAYVFLDGRAAPNLAAEIAAMREELEKQRQATKLHREEVDATWREQESINSGLHKFLLGSKHPEAIALRERVEARQAKIVRIRSREAP